MKNSRSRSGGSSVGVLKKFLAFGEYEGEFTEERPLLLELELISQRYRLHAPRQNPERLISWSCGPVGARKNYPVGTVACANTVRIAYS